MRLAIVGSVSLAGDGAAVALICNVLDRYQPTTVISGGAAGIDSMAASLARARGIEVVEHLPAYHRWTPNGFRERNLLIAQDCDVLVRIAAADSKTYGSGWTRDQAAKLGKPTETFTLPNAADPARSPSVEGDPR